MNENASNNTGGIKCFHFEDKVKEQVQSIFLFSDTAENAIKMFNSKEPELSSIRKAVEGTMEFNEPTILSEGLAELVKMLLYTKAYVENTFVETDLRTTTESTSKFYRFTPGRLIYILAKHSETKDKVKKVAVDSLFD